MKKYLCLTIAVLASACTGTRPTDIGVMDGHLSSCPDSDNCVSTQAADADHKIEPFPVKGNSEASLAILRDLIKDSPRSEVVTDSGRYIHAEFTSRLMRFVDDVEFFAPDSGQTIEVRSASRMGKKDFGVNRDRIEALRKEYLARP